MFQRSCVCLAALLAGICLPVGAEEVLTCTSPDGYNVISLQLVDGTPRYNVTYAGQAVIRDAALGLNLDEKPFGRFEIVGSRSGSVDTRWKPVVGEREVVRDCYHDLVVSLQEQTEPKRKLSIEFRAYNDGVAFRYVLPRVLA